MRRGWPGDWSIPLYAKLQAAKVLAGSLALGGVMLEELWSFAREHISDKFAESAATAFVTAILAYWKRDPLIEWFRRCFKRRRIRQGKWYTAFVKNGHVRVEIVKVKPIPFTSRYYGIVEYEKQKGQRRHYLFSGRLSEG